MATGAIDYGSWSLQDLRNAATKPNIHFSPKDGRKSKFRTFDQIGQSFDAEENLKLTKVRLWKMTLNS